MVEKQIWKDATTALQVTKQWAPNWGKGVDTFRTSRCPDFFLQPTSEWDKNESAKQRVYTKMTEFCTKKEKMTEFCPDFFLQPTSEWDQNESAKQRVCTKMAEFCTKMFEFSILPKKNEIYKNVRIFNRTKMFEFCTKMLKKNVIFGHFVVFELFVFDFGLLVNFGLLWQPVSSGHRLVRKVSTPLQ